MDIIFRANPVKYYQSLNQAISGGSLPAHLKALSSHIGSGSPLKIWRAFRRFGGNLSGIIIVVSAVRRHQSSSSQKGAVAKSFVSAFRPIRNQLNGRIATSVSTLSLSRQNYSTLVLISAGTNFWIANLFEGVLHSKSISSIINIFVPRCGSTLIAYEFRVSWKKSYFERDEGL